MEENINIDPVEENVPIGLHRKIGREEVQEAMATLQKYHEGKQNLENRVVQDELWYKLQHWHKQLHFQFHYGFLNF